MARSALVIDDSKSARFALRRYLENMSYVVDTAENAETAFNYLKDHHPEVIFLDHVMPGVDGFDVLNSIKSDPRTIDIPVVICSSNEGDAFTQEARFKGAAEVLSKPPTPQQLARVLSSLGVGTGTKAPAPAAPAAARPAHVPSAPASATPIAPPATAPARPHDDVGLGRVVALLEQLQSQMLRVTQDLSDQIADLKSQVSRNRGGGAFARFRTKVLGSSKSRLPRLSGRRKLPRK